MVAWLVPIWLFWVLSSLYIGGTDIRIEGGGGGRQTAGLLLAFAAYLAIWAGLRVGAASLMGPVWAVAVAALLTSLLLPFTFRFAFLAMGVRLGRPQEAASTAG